MSLAALLLCGSAVADAAGARSGSPAAESPASSCVAIQSSAPFTGTGYGHVASVKNNCAKAVRCELWTDVDPQPRHALELEPQARAELTFRRDSPAYQFRVFAQCSYR